jgi:hypothetical protein
VLGRWRGRRWAAQGGHGAAALALHWMQPGETRSGYATMYTKEESQRLASLAGQAPAVSWGALDERGTGRLRQRLGTATCDDLHGRRPARQMIRAKRQTGRHGLIYRHAIGRHARGRPPSHRLAESKRRGVGGGAHGVLVESMGVAPAATCRGMGPWVGLGLAYRYHMGRDLRTWR